MDRPAEATSGSYIWTYPGCPVRILLALGLIDQLRAEIASANTGTSEAGGLLIARTRSASGTVNIVDFIPFPPQPEAAGGHFHLAPERIAEAIARCPSDCRVVGYFRSDLLQSIHLRDDDREVISRCFPDPSGVFLVIATNGSDASGGFFVRSNGTLAANPGLSFPLSAAKLIADGWPWQAADSTRRTSLAGVFSRLGTLVGGGNVWIRMAVLSLVLALLIGIRLLTWNYPAGPTTAASSARLGLEVKRDGNKFVVSWNQSAPEIAKAKDAGLVIWDDSRAAVDGSNEPLFLPLSPPELRLGSLTYTSFSFTEKAKFRLDVTAATGSSVTESVVSVAPGNLPNPGLPQANAAERPASAQAVGNPEEIRTNPPLGEFRSGGSGAKYTATWSRPAPSGTRSSRRALRTFVPPKSGSTLNGPREVVMLAPPQMPIPFRLPQAPEMSNQQRPATDAAPPNQASGAGVITITSEPSAASVEINGARAGVTPITLQITPVGLGFTVTVTKEGFSKWTVQSFSTAQPYVLHAQLRPRSAQP